ncbi:aspartate aminotransferase family protein [Suttonella ornithocola]|nr:aspartate aminotransferase family protein [Suttonella ornithocola]
MTPNTPLHPSDISEPNQPNALMNNYARLPIAFTRGEGIYLYDEQNNQYIDALSGIAVCGLGHAHPELAETLATQAYQLWHTSNLFEIPAQTQAANTLATLSQMDKVIFCNSGTEANEAALKLTRLHARAKGIEYPAVISFYGGFHGRTFGSMAATANPKIRQHFEPQLSEFIHLPFNDIKAVEAQRYRTNVVAVLLECVQGEGGIHPATVPYIQAIRQICDEQGWLLICDEVQVGFGRSGKWFGYQHYNILPDIITLAKGLGNGIPVGVCLAKGKVADYFQPGYHGSTFAGSPLVMTVVNKVLEIYQRENIPENATKMGEYLQAQLNEKIGKLPIVKDIRGLGLMIGIELSEPVPQLVTKALENKLIINVTAQKVIRLLPPLVLTQTEADEIINRLAEVLSKC